jgi:hypothetical protein
VPQNTAGTWLLAASGSTGPFNQQHMRFAGPPGNDIQAIAPFSVSPSDTLRGKPWGKDGSDDVSNTQVLSMNNHVRGMLASGDLRRNYLLTGATWTPPGVNPTGPLPGVGTNRVYNATMETYQPGTNCFTCHQNFGNAANATTELSHIYPDLKPLF